MKVIDLFNRTQSVASILTHYRSLIHLPVTPDPPFEGRRRITSTKGAVSSVVEHYLDTVGVTGSNPVSRTVMDFRCGT